MCPHFIYPVTLQRKNTHSPIQRGSAINASLLLGPTSIQSFPSFTTGQDFLHSWWHFLGLHLEALRMAIRVNPSPSLPLEGLLAFFLGGIFDNHDCQSYVCSSNIKSQKEVMLQQPFNSMVMSRIICKMNEGNFVHARLRICKAVRGACRVHSINIIIIRSIILLFARFGDTFTIVRLKPSVCSSVLNELVHG